MLSNTAVLFSGVSIQKQCMVFDLVCAELAAFYYVARITKYFASLEPYLLPACNINVIIDCSNGLSL